MVEHEGTYLAWLDFGGTGLDVEQLEHLVIYEAKLWLDSGKIFGDSGRGFQRINVACPRAVLAEGLDRIKNALDRSKAGR
jgi:cystathionine beta-lyase